MKITAKTRYALRVLLDIAMHGDSAQRTIAEIAESQSISVKFISRIVVPLRRAGLIATERGIKGGIRLARSPENITIFEIVEAMEGPIGVVRCLTKPRSCPRQGACAAEVVWRDVNEAIIEALRSKTLAMVADTQRNFSGLSTEGPEYCI